MASFSNVVMIGNLVKDPERKEIGESSAVTKISIGINRSYKKKDGTMEKQVSFVDVAFFGKTADFVHKYFHKGEPILVQGHLQQDTWEDKETGAKRSRLYIVGEQVQFVNKKAETTGE